MIDTYESQLNLYMMNIFDIKPIQGSLWCIYDSIEDISDCSYVWYHDKCENGIVGDRGLWVIGDAAHLPHAGQPTYRRGWGWGVTGVMSALVL